MDTITANTFELTKDALSFLKEEGIEQEVIKKLEPLVNHTYDNFDTFDTALKRFLGDHYSAVGDKVISASEVLEDDEDTQSEDVPEDGSIYPYDPTKASMSYI